MAEQSVQVKATIASYLGKVELSSLLDAEDQARAHAVIIAAALVLKYAIVDRIHDDVACAHIMAHLQDVVDSALSALGMHGFRASDILQEG